MSYIYKDELGITIDEMNTHNAVGYSVFIDNSKQIVILDKSAASFVADKLRNAADMIENLYTESVKINE